MSMSIANKRPASAPKGPGRPRDAQKDAAIIGAAQRLFLERGFDGTSVDAIAEAAGVAKATVYARFADKEALLRTAIASKCATYLDADTMEWRAGRDLREGLFEISRRFLALVTDAEALSMHRLIMEEGQKGYQSAGPHLPTLFYESAILPTVERVARYISMEAETRGLAIADAQGAAWRFLGMVKGQDHMRAMLGVTPRAPDEIDRHLAECADDFIASTFAGATAPRR